MKPAGSQGTPRTFGPPSRGKVTMRSTCESSVPGRDVQAPRAARHSGAARVHAHAGCVQGLAHRRAGRSPEDLQGFDFGRDEAQLNLRAARVAFGRGRQRQLVEGKRPRRSDRLDERDPAHPAVVELSKQAPVLMRIAGVAIGEDVIRLPLALRVCTEREDESVVAQFTTCLGDDHPPRVLDALEDTAVPSCAEIGRDLAELESPHWGRSPRADRPPSSGSRTWLRERGS